MASKVIDNRVNFGSVKNPMPFPDFLDVQLKSFKDFLQLDTPPEERKNDGLYKVFAENFPITDTRNNFVLEFLDYYIDPPRYTIDECLERGLTYSVPLKAKLKLYCTDPDHEDFGTVIQDVFLGPIPYMTANGTFVINAGIYALSPDALNAMTVNKHCDMPTLFEQLQVEGKRTVAYPMHEPWLDVGRPDDLNRANAESGGKY